MPTEPETIDGEATEVDLPAVTGAIEVRERSTALVARDEISVTELVRQSQIIEEVMRQAMKDGVHYGRIPGVQKPTLLKPGAEKLNVLFRLAPSYRSERIWHDDGHLTVVAACTLTHIPTGLVVAEGEGLCTSREAKYAYRQGSRACPVCGKEAIIKGKAEYGGGWVCFKKKDGCNAKFTDDSAEGRALAAVDVGRVPNDDLADSYNTVLKMADKRALLAAVLNGTAASDVFTQDMEEASGSGGSDAATSSTAAGGTGSADALVEPPVTLPAAFPAGPDLGERIGAALAHVDSSVDWRATWENANVAKYGKQRSDLPDNLKRESMNRLAHVAAKLSEGGDFPPPGPSELQDAFEASFETEIPLWDIKRLAPAPVSEHVEPDDSIEFGEPA